MSVTICLIFENRMNWSKFVIKIKSEGYFEFANMKPNFMNLTLKKESQKTFRHFLF